MVARCAAKTYLARSGGGAKRGTAGILQGSEETVALVIERQAKLDFKPAQRLVMRRRELRHQRGHLEPDAVAEIESDGQEHRTLVGLARRLQKVTESAARYGHAEAFSAPSFLFGRLVRLVTYIFAVP